MRAIGAPIGAELPSETRILRRMPLAKASISMLTLSVSTSARGSPFLTGSPSFLIQRRILPSSMVSPILGISTFFIYDDLRVPFQDGEMGVCKVSRRGGIGALWPIYRLSVQNALRAGGHKGPNHPSTPPPPLRGFAGFDSIVNIIRDIR